MRPVRYVDLFRYASTADRVCIAVAIMSAAIAGSGFPLCNILAGKISAELAEIDDGYWICDPVTGRANFTHDHDESTKHKKAQKDAGLFALYLALAGVMQLIFAYLAVSLIHKVAENQAYRIRMHYITALLRQDIGWYDLNTDSSVVSRIVEDVRKVHEAIGPKLGLFVYYANNSLLCLIIGLYYGWILTLAGLSISPLSALVSFIIEEVESKLAVKLQDQFSQCGNVVQQALINIKTVMAFSAQQKEVEKYDRALKPAEATQVKRSFISGLGLGFSWFFKYCSYALTMWYGTKLAYDDINSICEGKQIYNVETIMIILFSVLDLQYNFAHCATFLESFAAGRGAASAIFAVIDRKPSIDSSSPNGIRGEGSLAGRVEFRNVTFAYPSRPDVKILQGFNLTIEPGMTVALVGVSGCGKTTCLQLLQRFYDVTEGAILIDGVDIRDYNLKWYRSQLSVVSQEPTLFNTTIEENIRYGNPGVSQEKLEQACSLANAHEFVSRLPNKYGTMVGDRGAQLSGGQKQRIAIARALIQDPSILLLDEATSALDLRTESIVQGAIDKVKQGRTAIIVAHRVATLKSADLICLIQDGQVVVQGTPKEIRQKSELYLSTLMRSDTHMGASIQFQLGDTIEIGHSDDEFLEDVLAVLHDAGEETEDEREKTSAEEKSLATTTTICKIAAMNKKEWPGIAFGLVISIIHGLVLPATGYVFGVSLRVFSMADGAEAERKGQYYALVFLVLGFIAFFTQFLSLASFGWAGGSLTVKLRKLMFTTMMSQELSWFQQPENCVGVLLTKISRDAASIQEATGTHLGIALGATTTIIASFVLCFYINWKLAVVGWALSPLILGGAYLNGRIAETQESMEKEAHERTSIISFEAVSNIRTVAALCLEDHFIAEFHKQQHEAHRSAKRLSHVLGLVFGGSHAAIHFAYAVILFYGGTLVQEESSKPEEKRTIDYGHVFTIGEALVWTIMEIGLTLAYLPNCTKAKVSAARIFTLLKRRQDSRSDGGFEMDSCSGALKFDHVDFRYKSRPKVQVLKDMSWEVEPNSRVAIVGPSGSGKSTIMELILRFYDPNSGKICLDDRDVKSIKVKSLREKIAIVSQEPAFFDCSLRENIAYGLSSGDSDMAKIEAAAKVANIHDFILSLPAGYDTRVGDMGGQLSGGQKQRVAIARALTRAPRIILLDEATSALETESERVVEEALASATAGRTCIKIVHKLETVQHSDKILVVKNGMLVEVGTHDELTKQNGVYYNLWALQAKQID